MLETNVTSYFFNQNASGPLVIEAIHKKLDPCIWLKENHSIVEEKLLVHGGVLLRNFNIQSLSEFNRFAQTLSPKLLDYVYRSTPRTKLGGKIYTTTEYPADRTIPLHNENSYSKSWPHKILFFSVVVAPIGGETPLADSRSIYKKLDPVVKDKFEKNGVLYIRNYTPGMDLSWQTVFQTENREEVEHFCKNNDLQFSWNVGSNELTTKQVCQASLVHPETKEAVWFNQAHLFHISALDDASRHSIITELGQDNIPRNAFYGDGSEIEPEVLNHIRETYESEKIKFPWVKGDILLLDNLLMAHGREPFQGERKVAVAMC